MRSLTESEEAEFRCSAVSHSGGMPAVEGTPTTTAAVSEFSYAVMIRIRVVSHWVWTTWMRFETHAEGVRFARQGNKIVRLLSPEWEELRQQTEPVSPLLIRAAEGNTPSQQEGETFFEFLWRLLSAYGFPEDTGHLWAVKARRVPDGGTLV